MANSESSLAWVPPRLTLNGPPGLETYNCSALRMMFACFRSNNLHLQDRILGLYLAYLCLLWDPQVRSITARTHTRFSS